MPRDKITNHNIRVGQAIIEAEVIELCGEHAASLCRYAASLTKRKTIIQEAMQKAFLHYFAAKMNGKHMDNPRTWLTCALRNCIMNCIRKSHLAVASGTEDSPAELQDTADGPNDVFERTLVALSAHERECLWLRIEGYMYDEIAQIMQIKKNAVGSLLARALRHFRKAGECALQRRNTGVDSVETYDVIAHLRFTWADTQYRKRVKNRVWAYLFGLGLLTAATALAAVLMK